MNSRKNQSIKRKFVDREVMCNVTHLICELSKIQEHLDYEDQEALWNLQSKPDYVNAVLDSEYHIIYSNFLGGFVWVDRESHSISNNTFNTEFEVCEDCCLENNIDFEYTEAYEFWIVTDWLGKKLKEKNELVEEIFGITVWSRCTSGQAILLDSVISEICNDMKILEGQDYEWSL